MRKIAILVLLSMLAVSVLQAESFAESFAQPVGAVTIERTYTPLPDGGYKETTKKTIEPSSTGAKYGASAGAAGGAAAGAVIAGPIGAAVGAGIGAIGGAIAGWIFGPAD